MLVLVSLPTLASAQTPRRPIVRLHTGITLPSQATEFSDYWNAGFNLGGSLGFPVSSAFSLEAGFGFNNLAFDREAFLTDIGLTGVTVTGGAVTIITATADAVARIRSAGSRVAPYFVAGFGMMRLATADITASDPGASVTLSGSSETAFLASFGLGLEVMAGKTAGVLFELRYGIATTPGETTQFFPIKVGLVLR